MGRYFVYIISYCLQYGDEYIHRRIKIKERNIYCNVEGGVWVIGKLWSDLHMNRMGGGVGG